MNNLPAWMTQKGKSGREDKSSKRARFWVTMGKIFSTPSAQIARQIPLPINNALPAVEFRFGTDDENEIQFLCHVDSCAGMNTGSLLMHQWVMTKCPHIVAKYEEFNDENPFTPSNWTALSQQQMRWIAWMAS